MIVASVASNGPAAQAGVQVGDILTMINDIRMRDVTSMVNEVAKLKPGSSAKISFLTCGQTIQLPIVIGERPTVSTTAQLIPLIHPAIRVLVRVLFSQFLLGCFVRRGFRLSWVEQSIDVLHLHRSNCPQADFKWCCLKSCCIVLERSCIVLVHRCFGRLTHPH